MLLTLDIEMLMYVSLKSVVRLGGVPAMVIIFCPFLYPQLIRLLSYRRYKEPYFKGHLGLQN